MISLQNAQDSGTQRRLRRHLASAAIPLITLGLLCSVAPTRALAEDNVQRFAPPVERKGNTGYIRANDSSTTRSEQERGIVLVKDLKGLVFVDKPQSVRKGGAKANGVEVKAAPDAVPANVRAAAERLLGRTLTFGDLDAFTRELVLAYRDADRAVVNVVVPEQKIANNTLQVLVVIGRLGRVTVQGAQDKAAAEKIVSEVHLPAKQPISETQLLEDLRFLNRNPFRRVDAIYAPGKSFGVTDVALQALYDKPWTVYGGIETKGSRPLNRNRLFGGVMTSNVFGLDEVLGYQFTTSPKMQEQMAHFASLRLPLPARTEFQMVAGYSTSKADSLGVVTNTGKNVVVGGYFVAPLPHFGRIIQDVKFGVEYKSTNNNVDFGGATVVNATPTIYQAVVSWIGETNSRLGRTRWSVDGYYSPGGVDNSNNAATFSALRPNASANYEYGKYTLDHRLDLPNDFRLTAMSQGQVASTNLLPTEQLLLGGLDSVRGFEYGIARGDSGFLGSASFYLPGIRLLGAINAAPEQAAPKKTKSARMDAVADAAPALQDELRFYTFYDYGVGFSKNLLPQEASKYELSSAGVGATYTLGRYLSADVGYGWKLWSSGITSQYLGPGAWYMRVTGRF